MTFPRFFSTILVLEVSFACWYSVRAEKLQGVCEDGCLDVDQDDTGLIQSPVRNKVEVTKARSIVGNAMAQEGASRSGAAVESPASDVDAANSASKPSVLIASSQEEPANAGPVEEKKAEQASADAPPPAKGKTDAAALVANEPEVVGKAEDEDGRQRGLSFFQLDQEDSPQKAGGSREDGSDAEDAAEDEQSGDWDEDVSDGAVPTSSEGPGAISLAIQANLQQVMLVIVAISIMVHFMIKWQASNSRPRDALSTKMRKKLERMNVASGADIRTMCAMDGGEGEAKRPDAPLRIQGRVVNKASGPLMAPLSGRSCVLYSASVSQHRNDGVHQPPVAFNSSARDFSIQLEDCPEMFLDVNCQDVFPFDMESGRYACELSLREAPDAWRGFTLGNLVPNVEACGAAGQSMNRVDLGAKGPLSFRECALVLGSRVTCVGEVVREHNGKLRLCPWSPAPDLDAEESPKSRSMGWLTPEAEPWRHKLIISDDSRLLVDATLQVPGKCRSCTGAISS
jgi:hypothetical protein